MATAPGWAPPGQISPQHKEVISVETKAAGCLNPSQNLRPHAAINQSKHGKRSIGIVSKFCRVEIQAISFSNSQKLTAKSKHCVALRFYSWAHAKVSGIKKKKKNMIDVAYTDTFVCR